MEKKVSFDLSKNEIIYLENEIESSPELEKPIGPEDSEKKFKLQQSRFLLTYKTHINKENLKNFFQKLCEEKSGKDKPEIKFYRAAHEYGTNNKIEKEPYAHTHVVLEFTKNFVSTNQRIFDYEEIHPHIKYCAKNAQTKFTAFKRYIAKEDPENEDLLKETASLVDKVFACENIIDAVKIAQKPSDINGIISLYQLKPIEKPNPKFYNELGGSIYNFHTWQKHVYNEMINMTKNSRSITWIYDSTGKSGKSLFANELEMKGIAYRVEGNGGGFKDCAFMLIQAYKTREWDGKNIIFDFPRSVDLKQTTSLYPLMEMICNQSITSSKYKSEKTFVNQKTQVYVFSNYEPQFKNEYGLTLSLDRWNCHCIKSKGEDKVFSKNYHEKTKIILNVLKEEQKNKNIISEDDEETEL